MPLQSQTLAQDPREADLFFVPAQTSTFGEERAEDNDTAGSARPTSVYPNTHALAMPWCTPGGNTAWHAAHGTHLSRVLNHVRMAYPFWNASGGHDHIIWATGDQGAVRWGNASELLAPPIKVVHFGFTGWMWTNKSTNTVPVGAKLLPQSLC